jgi:hypothetical protein
MRRDATAEQALATGMNPSVPWRISALEVQPGHRLKVQFLDGTKGTVDMSRLIFSEHAGVFEYLRDSQVLNQAALITTFAHICSWVSTLVCCQEGLIAA